MEHTINNLIPVLPIRNAVVFPGLAMPLRVGRAKSIAAVQQAQLHGSWILIVTQRLDEANREPIPSDLYDVGVLCKIEKVQGTPETGYQILIRGVDRYRVAEYHEQDQFIEAQGDTWKDVIDADEKTMQALLGSLKTLSHEILAYVPANTEQLDELVEGITDIGYLSNLCAGNLELPLTKKQEILETISVKTRVLMLLEVMNQQKEGLKVQSEIRDKLTTKMGKAQRESILREQLKAIREELGEGEGGIKGDDLREKIINAKMPEDVEKMALEELRRLESMGPSSPESHVIRNYIELLVAMPWSKSAVESEIDLEKARTILDEDHYGLHKIKRRILQHLAVMKLKKNGRGSIMIFVGPPGVGKTSLGQTIAKALGRKFVRGSLGGVRDDAEIRGHRRTYIGAMPGRIIQGIKRAGENNPVFMLDEIDKLSRSFQGDPASALLEVLDPEQNNSFLDHYLDVPFDLSKVFFIATANTLESIPGPLLDRMEVIDLSGYTTPEKLHIAKNHLIPKQLAEHGLSPEQLVISDEAILRTITHYTREAGVRELQRMIAAICRGASERVVSAVGIELPVRIEVNDLEELLGGEKFIHEVAQQIAPPGVVTGLAWTPQGGEILFIESTVMPGSGRLTLTGQLGEVMKESAQIALSLVRSHLSVIGPTAQFDKQDVHVHVPSGAIPKDGPSAGVAILTAIASLFSGRRVLPTVAMTGEITLRGAVMPVGGIKEKVLGAHRAGITHVILPKRNEKDLKDVPEEVRSQMKFNFVETAAEVLKIALDLDWEQKLQEGIQENPPPPPQALA